MEKIGLDKSNMSVNSNQVGNKMCLGHPRHSFWNMVYFWGIYHKFVLKGAGA